MKIIEIRATAVSFGVPETRVEVQLLETVGTAKRVTATYHFTFGQVFADQTALEAAVAAELATLGETVPATEG